jgi:hypothetical protein
MRYWLDYDEDSIRAIYRDNKAKQMSMPRFSKEELMEDLGYTEEEAEVEIGGLKSDGGGNGI